MQCYLHTSYLFTYHAHSISSSLVRLQTVCNEDDKMQNLSQFHFPSVDQYLRSSPTMFSGHCVKNIHKFSTTQLQSFSERLLISFSSEIHIQLLVCFLYKFNIFLVMCGSVEYNSVLDYLHRHQKVRLMHKYIF